MSIELELEEVRPLAAPRLLTRVNARLAWSGMCVAMVGLMAIVCVVFYQVFGRYVLNDSPTWAESLAIVLVLYVTLIGAAVGVRDAGHIGLESFLVMLPDAIRRKVEIVIYALVGVFGACMAYNGWVLGTSVAAYYIPNLHVSEAVRYIPLVLSGVLIVLFAIEHVVAIIRGEEVAPSWN
ncbi:TRAP-type C4-dicarboxylate transport system permease small subunit [Azospirillum brasilense]|uniref:TRAP transporter small permease protein n=2 Tax=Azospirillum TaxID=191 RepID=A0A4D8RFE3_AZOBR|nr:TRAP transporter small permease [Azospirillum brasilense]MBK3737478.1 TRAP transporter small permease subunit [Azospirillum brasilense]QCO19153.1 TRAP transporter small permease [Azospirillum brasilense]TWA62498.1 TRAP-type C4-dicarboxylate transport system permease small subunit [Azospirillum brasilense]TWA77693.1 TRAP-type C4-dicarboxylate transport system permease small subunit [Azospirillum brasilense]